MKSIAASNVYLRTPAARKEGVERNVRSSSAIEGVSAKVFRSAVDGRFVTTSKSDRTTVVKDGRPKKK
ncbi:hypothetical protein [Montanilutibacter psychrotolerans]|uniref:Uncharacterized protein n=1 Tax=Montanilutibacter psychrotolerans TaxID=1327343 RepID=A0A3M8SLZ6_9GAMM|nr:hypothetical protein [Lysobacter psychrotolerans]RNF82249.1 hypothetical protein EER27_15155 [Lysobacter psychrotolerans]